MKISKAYIKRVILEELSRLEEETPAPEQLSLPFKKPSAEEIKKQKEETIAKINSLDAQLKAAEAAQKNILILKKQLDDARKSLQSIGG